MQTNRLGNMTVPQDRHLMNFKLDQLVRNSPVPLDWETPDVQLRGFCYLVCFPTDFHREISYAIGAFPKWGLLKTYGAGNATGPFHIVRRNGYTHITAGGSGYSIRDLNIRDEEVVGALPVEGGGPLLRMFVILFMLLAACLTSAEGRRCSSMHYLTNKLQVDFPGTTIPEDFQDIYTGYLIGRVIGLPPEYICLPDTTLRDRVLSLDWENEAIMELIKTLCPAAVKSGVTFVEIDLFLERQGMVDTNRPQTIGGLLDSAYETARDDAVTIIDEMPGLHTNAKEMIGRTARLFNTITGEALDTTIDGMSQASGMFFDRTKEVVRETLGAVDNTAIRVIDQTSGFVREIVNTVDTQMTSARERAGMTVATGTNVLWTTIDGLNKQVEVREGTLASILKQTAEAGDEIAGIFKDPKFIIQNVKKKQKSLAEIGEIVGDSLSKVSTDAMDGTKKAYASGESLLKGMYDNSYTGEEIALGIVVPAKDFAESIVPAIKDVGSSIYNDWRGYLREAKETAGQAVSNGPWMSETCGRVAGGFINGFATELGIKDIPKWIGKLRNETLGPPPKPPEVMKEPWWRPSREGNWYLGIINNVQDQDFWKTTVSISLAITLSVAVILVTARKVEGT